MRIVVIILSIVFSVCIFFNLHTSAEVLITESEAALPAQRGTSLDRRGITRGPSLDQVAPSSEASVQSPLTLKIKFTAHNNAKVDPATLKASYLRAMPVDLTERLRKHTNANGIDMPDAEVPSGTHLIRVEVKDNLGRNSISIIKLDVQ
jgi:hypothetical protein